jgi:hypothetical protein
MSKPSKILKVCAFAALTFAATAFGGERPPELTDALLDAIRFVESGDREIVPDGDGGRAIGPYQIWKVYYLDACEYDPSLRARGYEACRDEAFARRVVIAYMSRYGRGKSAEDLARIHNGGPKGHRKDATAEYWDKVEKRLNERD